MVLAVTQLAASACGFFRDQAFSVMFPLGEDPIGVASVYIAAFRPSDLLFQLFVMSCLSVVMVPFLASHLAHERREEMNRILTSTLVFFGLVFGVVALIGAIIFPKIAPLLTKFQGESLELYIRFGRIAFLTNFLFVFGNTLGQYLIAVQRYWVYGLTPILWSLGTIAGTYFLTPFFGPLGPIYGTLGGTVLYVLIRFGGVLHAGFLFGIERGRILHREFRQMGILILPRMAALGALQLQLLLLDRLASGLGKSMVAVNQFAANFESVIPGIVGIALAQSVFSLLSQSAARGDTKRFSEQLRHSIGYNLALAIPGAVALALLTGVAAWIMRLSPDIAPTFMRSLLIYAFAVPFESTNYVILRSFYSLKNTAIPAVSSALSCIFAVTAGTLLIDSIGIYALAVAYVTAQVCQTAFLGSSLGFMLRRHDRGLKV